MNSDFDIITIGDSTVDTFIKIHEASIECDINKKDCKICVDYGGKVPVESISYGIAGNAANVAAGCAVLGMKTAIYTHLGKDWQGEMIKQQFKKFNIADDYIVVDAKKSSNLSVALTYKGERTIFVYHQDWSYRLPKLGKAKWVYLTSLSASFADSSINSEVSRYIDEAGAKMVFAPGTYQIRADVKKFKEILERTYMFTCNLDEAKDILEADKHNTWNEIEVLDRLHALGPKIVAITDGEKGSYASDGQKYLRLGIFPTKVVEKTGAGDSYASAFIAALESGADLGEAMVWGTINSSHVIQEAGAQNGLLSEEGIIRHRKSVPELVAVAI